jgi:DHA1 family multidrug resistance protein-like MFS transporter
LTAASSSEDQTRANQGSWVWLLVLFTAGAFFETVFYGQLTAFTPLYLPYIGVQPDQVARWIGIIAAVSGILGLPFLPFWGALADRFSRKPIIIRSFVLHLIAGVASILAGNIWVFLLARSISSLSLGNSGLMMTTLSERAPANRHGLAFSIMNSASQIGGFIGPLVGGPIVDRWGFRTLIGIDTILMLAVVLSLTFGYHDLFKSKVNQPILQMAGDSLHILMNSARLKALFPALFFLFAGSMLARTYVPLAISNIYPVQDINTIIGFILGAGGFLAIFVSPGMGALADKYGHWKLLFIGAIVEIFLWPLPAFTHNLFTFGAAWALISGIGAGVFSISFTVLSNSTTSEVRGRVMSFAYLPVNVGSIIGPAIGAVISHGNVLAIFPAAAVLTAVGVGLLVAAWRLPVSNQ